MNKHTKRIIKLIEGEESFGLRFYEKTKAKKISIPPTVKEWPQSWKAIHYKTYPRFRAFKSAESTEKRSYLVELLQKRRSTRDFSNEQLAFTEFFSLLQPAAGITTKSNSPDERKRAYASAGARYPLELYALVLHVSGLAPGLYHYSVKEDLIELLFYKDLTGELKDIYGEEAWIEKAAAILFITGVPERTATKYGDRGHRFMYIEAGLLAQNVSLLAADMGVGACLVGGFVEDKVIELLDLQIQSEYPLLSIVIGKEKQER